MALNIVDYPTIKAENPPPQGTSPTGSHNGSMDTMDARSLLSRLTIIIPTYNRPVELRQLVRYWSKWPVSLVILDGLVGQPNVEGLSIQSSNITFFQDASFDRRLEFASNHIETPYACLHADDNFLLARSAARAMALLESRSDLVSIAGDAYSFNQKNLFRPGWTAHEVDQSTPRQRLFQHFREGAWGYTYGIHRAPQLQAILRAVSAAGEGRLYEAYPCPQINGEYAIEIAGAVLGRLGNAEEALVLVEVGNVGVSESFQQKWPDWLRDPRAATALAAWRAVLSDHLSRHLGEASNTVDGWITELFDWMLETQDPWARKRDKGINGWLRYAYSARIPRDPESKYVSRTGFLGSLQRLHKRFYWKYRAVSGQLRRALGILPIEVNTFDRFRSADTNWGDSLDIPDVKEALEWRLEERHILD